MRVIVGHSRTCSQTDIFVDDEDFEHLKDYAWTIAKKRDVYYAYRKINKKSVYMHRIILKSVPGQIVDHINRNGLDNRKENLRLCTKSENGQNRGKQANGKSSKYKGVTKRSTVGRRKVWHTQLTLNGETLLLC